MSEINFDKFVIIGKAIYDGIYQIPNEDLEWYQQTKKQILFTQSFWLEVKNIIGDGSLSCLKIIKENQEYTKKYKRIKPMFDSLSSYSLKIEQQAKKDRQIVKEVSEFCVHAGCIGVHCPYCKIQKILGEKK